MSIRSMMLIGTLGLAALAGTAAADTGAKTNGGHGGGGGFVCTNGVGVGCIGSIAILPINVNIKDISALDDSDLTILSDDLNALSLLDGNILDHNVILNDVYATVLSDFLDKFGINLSGNDVGVCTNLLGIQLCK